MRLQRTFLLSLYLNLGLACAAMSFAVQPYLPELTYLTWGVILLLALAFIMEGRWTLSTLGANLMAVLIAAATGLWLAYQLGRPPTARVDIAILSAPLLPHLGALLMVLMVVKLFRPKRIGDYWWLYAIGFMSVALACVLDSEAMFGVLLCAYAACSVWSLSLFALVRGLARQASPASVMVPWRGLGLFLAARRAMLITAIGVVLFLVTPRISSTAWLGQPVRVETGLSDSSIDLNRSGDIELNTEVAFAVVARDRADQPKLDLDAATRFRGMALNIYSRGAWNYRPNQPAKGQSRTAVRATGLADFGPEQYSLAYTYTYRPRHRLVLAEPIILPPEPDLAPVVSLTEDDQPVHWLRLPSGSLLSPSLPRGTCRYLQISRPVSADDTTATPLDDDQLEVLTRLPNLPGLSYWTTGILEARVRSGELAAADFNRFRDGSFSSGSYERLARALEAHLSASGEYTYTLEQPRRDHEIDPVLDFLWNVKRGHCQRFASALAAMLRSQKIPAQVVLGFRGVEHQGDGTYLVRHSQAHAWVEALVWRRAANGKWAPYWLTLDPTPPGEAVDATGSAAWYREVSGRVDSLWRNFVLDFHAEKQAAALEFWDREQLVRLGGWALILGGLIGLLAIAYRTWRKRGQVGPLPTSSDPLYARLLGLLAQRFDLWPKAEQTPREFAHLAGQRLEAVGLGAGLPNEIVGMHYRLRYGGQAIPEPERCAASGRLDELERTLMGPDSDPDR